MTHNPGLPEPAATDAADPWAAAKSRARQWARAARKAAHAAQGGADSNAGAAVAVADHFITALNPRAGQGVGVYLPIGSELDTAPLRRALRERGCTVLLPCVVAAGAALLFRPWEEGEALVQEDFGTRAPAADIPARIPDMLAIPLLAWSRAGWRLGYGGGFYDRSLQDLRAGGAVIAVGIGYAAQEMADLPVGGHDEPLDWIVTERGTFQP